MLNLESKDKQEEKKAILLLLSMLCLTLIIVFGFMFHSGHIYMYEDIGADTRTSYAPFYNHLINQIKEGNLSSWTDEAGLGESIYARTSIYAEPILMLTLSLGVVFGQQTLPLLLVIFKSITIVISAIYCYKYLKLFSDKHYIISLVAYMYSYNGFSIIWGQHYYFSFYSMYMIVIVYYIEKFIRKKEKLFYFPLIIVSFVVMLYSPYLVYMVYLPMIIYSIIRYIYINSKLNIRDFIKCFFNLAFNIIIGFMGSMILSCGTVITMLNSGRVALNGSIMGQIKKYLSQWVDFSNLVELLQRFLSGNYSGVANAYNAKHYVNYYEAPQLFFTIFFWIFFFQFIFTLNRKSKKKNILISISILLIILLLINYGFKYIEYACSGICERYTFIVFPFFSLMILEVLDNLIYKRIFSFAGFIVALGVSVFLLIYPIFNESNVFLGYFKYLFIVNIFLFVIGCILLLCFIFNKNMKNNIFLIILTILCFANITVEMFVCTNREGNVSLNTVQELYSYNDTRKALDYLNSIDNTYYRIEKTYDDCSKYTDSLFYGYRSISTYNSLLSNELQGFDENYMSNVYTYAGSRLPAYYWAPYEWIQYSQLGLKYVLSKDPIQDNQHLKLLKKIGTVYIYRNQLFNSFVTMFDTVINKSDFEKLDYFNKSKVISQALIMDDQDIKHVINNEKSVENCLNSYKQQNCSNSIKNLSSIVNKQGAEKEILFDKNLFKKISGNLVIEMKISSEIAQPILMYTDEGSGWIVSNPYRFSISKKNNEIRYLISNRTQRIKLQAVSDEFTISQIDIFDVSSKLIPDNCESVFTNTNKENLLEGTVNCYESGILLFPMAYDQGWRAYIDGKEYPIYKVNYGLMAIKLEEGSHSIIFKYYDRNIRIGFVFFIISLITTCIYYFFSKLIIRKKYNDEIKFEL